MAVNGHKIALIGFMGCGKTSIGAVLAARLAFPFIDLDKEIERSSSRTVRHIFETEGEASFRKMEEEALSEIARRDGDLVLSCGGGIVISPPNRKLLASAYLTVFIDVPFSELVDRLSRERDDRPLLAAADFETKARELLEARLPLYEAAAVLTYRWKTGDSTTESADLIMKAIAEASV